MDTKSDLHRLVELIPEEDVVEVIDYVRWLLEPYDTLTAEELEMARAGQEQIARGEYVTLADLSKSLEA